MASQLRRCLIPRYIANGLTRSKRTNVQEEAEEMEYPEADIPQGIPTLYIIFSWAG